MVTGTGEDMPCASPVSGRAGLAQESERPAQGWGAGGGRPSVGRPGGGHAETPANYTIDFVKRLS